IDRCACVWLDRHVLVGVLIIAMSTDWFLWRPSPDVQAAARADVAAFGTVDGFVRSVNRRHDADGRRGATFEADALTRSGTVLRRGPGRTRLRRNDLLTLRPVMDVPRSTATRLSCGSSKRRRTMPDAVTCVTVATTSGQTMEVCKANGDDDDAASAPGSSPVV